MNYPKTSSASSQSSLHPNRWQRSTEPVFKHPELRIMAGGKHLLGKPFPFKEHSCTLIARDVPATFTVKYTTTDSVHQEKNLEWAESLKTEYSPKTSLPVLQTAKAAWKEWVFDEGSAKLDSSREVWRISEDSVNYLSPARDYRVTGMLQRIPGKYGNMPTGSNGYNTVYFTVKDSRATAEPPSCPTESPVSSGGRADPVSSKQAAPVEYPVSVDLWASTSEVDALAKGDCPDWRVMLALAEGDWAAQSGYNISRG